MLQSDGIIYSNDLDKAKILNKCVLLQYLHMIIILHGSSPYPGLPSFETSVEEV